MFAWRLARLTMIEDAHGCAERLAGCSRSGPTQKAVRGDRGDGQRGHRDRARLPGAPGVGVRLLRAARPSAVGEGPAAHVPDRAHPGGAPRQSRQLRGSSRPRRTHPRPRSRGWPLRGGAAHAESRARRIVRTSALPTAPQRGHGIRPGRTALRARGTRPAHRSPTSPSIRHGRARSIARSSSTFSLVGSWAPRSMRRRRLPWSPTLWGWPSRGADPAGRSATRTRVRSSRRGRSRGGRSTRVCCPRWARSGAASITR
jgi:hypothetical protein